jgi:hypothetical protein
MPEVSRFYGIIIRAIHQGHLPKTAYELLDRWRKLHLQELRDDWNRAREQRPLLPIAPLD